jgi:phage terminase large subunit
MKPPQIDFATYAHLLFTSVYYSIRECSSRIVVIFGGAGSSKSYSAHQNELIKLMQRTKGDTLVLRKHSVDNRLSTFKLFEQLIAKYNLRPYFKSVYSGDNKAITYIPTGCSIIFRGADDTEKLKSITNIKRVLMEEASEFEFDDIQITLILNPISENHWIKKQIVDEDGPYHSKADILKFTYHDNPFMTKDDIDNLEIFKLVDENHYRIYVLAEWGIEDKTKKYAWAFDDKLHVKEGVVAQMHKLFGLPYNPRKYVWLTFDFNISNITCTVAQHYPEYRLLKVLDCLKLKNATTDELCRHIKAKYPDAQFQITGDASGKNRSTIAMGNDVANNYLIIKKILGVSSQAFKVPNANPSIEDNRMLLNTFFKNYGCEIDSVHGKPVIYDLNYVEVNENKEILKDRSSESKLSDFLDNFRYLLNVLFPDIRHLLPKKPVL